MVSGTRPTGGIFFRQLIALVVALSMSHAVYAMDPEWQWLVVGRSPPTFLKKADAVDYMHSLTGVDSRYALLTNETKVSYISDKVERFTYEAPKVVPNVDQWSYQDVSIGGPHFATEAETLQYALSLVFTAPQCSKYGAPASSWTTTITGYGGVAYIQERTYTFTSYSFAEQTGCVPYFFNHTFRRTETISCPSGYYGESAPPGCYLPFTAQIEGRRLYRECSAQEPGDRGNPCNAVTGDKSETATDYSGLDELVCRASCFARLSER